MTEATNYHSTDTLANCIALINRHAPMLMKTGGALLGPPNPNALTAPSKMRQAISEKKQKMIDLRAQGVSVKQIAITLGCHTNTVYKWLNKEV